MKSKSYLSIENDMKCEKMNEMLLYKVSASSYESKNGVFLGWSRLLFSAMRLVDTGAILGQSESFKTKYIEFLY